MQRKSEMLDFAPLKHRLTECAGDAVGVKKINIFSSVKGHYELLMVARIVSSRTH